MRSRIEFIAGRVEGNLDESGTPIVLAWQVWPADAVPDPVTRLRSGTPTPRRETVNAFLHFVSATSAVRQFNEIQVGDCIADLSPSVVLPGRDGLAYLLPTGPDGALETWSNKPLSSQLAAFWDTQQGGVRLFQTVLLRKAT